MKTLASLRLPLLGGALTLAAVVVWIAQPRVLQWMDGLAYDAQARSASPCENSGEVAIVEIDEASLKRFGQWPWRRDVIAKILDQIQDAGASVIALDAVFAEPEQRLGEASVKTEAARPRKALAITATGNPATHPHTDEEEGDAILTRSLQKSQVVLGHYFRFGDGQGSEECNLHPLSLSTAFRYDPLHEPFLRADAVTCSLVSLSNAAVGSGFLNASPDSDGILRRTPLLMSYKNQVHPSLPLAAVMAHWKVRTAQLRQDRDRSEWLQIGDRLIPVGSNSNMLLRFQDPSERFPRVSAASLPAEPGVLKGKIVLVGAIAAGLQDTLSTPLWPSVSGTTVHATAIENLLTGNVFRRPPNARMGELLLVVLSGLLSTWLLSRQRPWVAAMNVAGIMIITWFGTAKLMDLEGQFVSPALAIVLTAANLAVLTLVNLSLHKGRAERSEVQAEAARRFMVSMVTNLAKVRDLETGEHLLRLQRYTWVICVALSSHPRFRSTLTPERIALITELVPMHDIGKVGVPDSILRKPGRLTPEEFDTIRKHVEHGRDALIEARSSSVLLDDVVYDIAYKIICHHHERWDGTGYPQGLRGEEISPEGRIIAIVDVYDALISERAYKRPLSHEDALDVIRQGRGTHFDPAVVDAFLRVEQGIARTNIETPVDSMGDPL